MPDFDSKACLCLELPMLDYSAALAIQHHLAFARQTGALKNDIVLILEHPCVFTLGRRGGIKNLKVSNVFLNRLNIPVIQAERGGDITFHGPGQLVVYPIFDLYKGGLKIIEYVTCLEEIMLRTVSDWGLFAKRNPINRGIWIANKKLGSIGISVRRGVSFHGLALNVDLPLAPFRWIHPCGLVDVAVTSMANELSKTISMKPVRDAVKYHLASVFGFDLINIENTDIYCFLENCIDRNVLMTLSRPV